MSNNGQHKSDSYTIAGWKGAGGMVTIEMKWIPDEEERKAFEAETIAFQQDMARLQQRLDADPTHMDPPLARAIYDIAQRQKAISDKCEVFRKAWESSKASGN